MDEVKKEIRKEQIKAGVGNPIDDDGGESSDEDEDKYVDKMDMPGRFLSCFFYSSRALFCGLSLWIMKVVVLVYVMDK